MTRASREHMELMHAVNPDIHESRTAVIVAFSPEVILVSPQNFMLSVAWSPPMTMLLRHFLHFLCACANAVSSPSSKVSSLSRVQFLEGLMTAQPDIDGASSRTCTITNATPWRLVPLTIYFNSGRFVRSPPDVVESMETVDISVTKKDWSWAGVSGGMGMQLRPEDGPEIDVAVVRQLTPLEPAH